MARATSKITINFSIFDFRLQYNLNSRTWGLFNIVLKNCEFVLLFLVANLLRTKRPFFLFRSSMTVSSIFPV